VDLEGTIQFIINQQAQFVADIHSLQESQRVQGIRIDKIAEQMERQQGTVEELAGTVGELVGTVEELTGTVGEMAGTVEELTGTVVKLTGAVGKLSEIAMHHEDAHVVAEGMISRLAGALTDYAERQGWLFDAQKRTETKLDKFIDKMDGFIDEMRRNFEGRNGGSGSG